MDSVPSGLCGREQLSFRIYRRIFRSAFWRREFLFPFIICRKPPTGTGSAAGRELLFAFALVGVAFFDYLSVALFSFDESLQSARQNGTLENLLVTQTPFPVILAGSAVYPFVILSLRTVIYLGWGVVLFHFPVQDANWVGALLILAASILAFSGLGILSASYLLVFKRGNPVAWAVIGLSSVLGGMLYPVTVLPWPLRRLSRLVPVTYSLEGMRAALLNHATLTELWPSLAALLIFAAILLPLSFLAFAWALRRTKITGTLTHF